MASMESRLILGGCSRNLFFSDGNGCADVERLPQSQHVGQDQQSRLLADKTKQSEQSRRNPEQLAQVFLDLDRSGQVLWCLHLFIQQSEFAKSQLECK